MRKLILATCALLLFISCKNQENKDAVNQNKLMAYESFGKEIEPEEVFTADEMLERYNKLEVGDTLQLSFKTNVNAVCKKKGCWMTLKVPGEEEVMVKFKDYSFFVPKNIENKEVIVQGKAYINEVPVDELKHYAEDAGKTETEIAAITSAQRKMSFLAEGVLLKE